MNKQSICFSDIHPFVRYVQKICIVEETYPSFCNVLPYDARFFYVLSGTGALYIGNERHSLCHGKAMMWMPGIAYLIKSDDEVNDPLILLGCNFDFTQRDRHSTAPIPPEPLAVFDAKRIKGEVNITDFPRLNLPVVMANMDSIEEPMQRMLQEFKVQKLFYEKKLSAILTEIIVTIGRRLMLYDSDKSQSVNQGYAIITYIHEHFDEELDNKKLGAYFGYHPNHLNRIIKRYTGRTLHQYINRYRIACAVDLLLSTNLPIAEISTRVGFHDASHFSNTFKQIMGCPPVEMRNGRKISFGEMLPTDKLIRR